MALRLDPRFPLVWRTPQSLQFGLDRPRVVLDEVSSADERVVAALVAGVSRSGAEMIGSSAGLDPAEVRALLEALGPAMTQSARPEPSPAPGSVVVCGRGETADRLRDILGRSGATILEDDEDANPGLAVIVAHYVIEPELHGRWLRRDIPHLPIVFGDEVVRIGPIVRPGIGPCLYCLALYRSAADPAWPAIASQLWGRRSPVESALVATEVAAIGARLVLSAFDTGSVEGLAAEDVSIEIDAATGEWAVRACAPHPDCGCISVSGPAPTAQGTATGGARGRDPIRLMPRRDAGVGAPG
jgi:bacteriocin biosynthesis cyclodehydratase domain-containing protein